MNKLSHHPLSEESLDLQEIEKRTILRALEAAENDCSEAAKRLNIDLESLAGKIKQYNISFNKSARE